MKPEQTQFLSQAEREIGLDNFQKHSFWNGLGINFLNTPIVSLLAITFGASNIELGYISSVFHFAGIILIFLPRLLSGVAIRTAFFFGWLIRGLVCFLYGLLFFLDGQAAVSTILVLYTLFALSRMVGAPMVEPIQRNFVRGSEAGSIVVKIHQRLAVSEIISRIVSFLLLSIRYFSGLTGLVLLTWIGAVNNTISSLYIRKIPSREKVEYRKGKNIFVLLAETCRHPIRGRVFAVRMLNLASGILITFGVAFLRRAVQMPSNMVFIYTLAGSVGALTATQALKPIVDSIGSRPLMVISAALLATAAFGWAFLPPDLPWVVYYVYGFFILFFLRFRLLLMSRLIIKTLPSNDRISYTAMLNFASAIVGITVGLTGGALADYAEIRALAVPHIYTFTYLLAGVFGLLSAVIALKLHDPGSLSLRETVSSLLSVRTMRAYLDIYNLGVTQDRRKRESKMLSLEQSNTQVATEEMRSRLRSPLPWEQERILRSLSTYPRPELLDDIIREATDPGSYNRREAIFTLGAYPSTKTEETLKACAEDPSPEIASAALRSLGRIGHTTDLERVYQVIENPEVQGRAVIDTLRALMLMDRDGDYIRGIFSLVPPEKGERIQELTFILCARNYSFDPPLSDFFELEHHRKGTGFSRLLREARDVAIFNRSRRLLQEMYDRSEFDKIWRWCSDQLGDKPVGESLASLRFAITDTVPQAYTEVNTIASVYFTYQLFKFAGT